MKKSIGRQDIPGLVIMVIIGIALTAFGSLKIKSAQETKKWPVTTGIVTVSEIAGAIKYYPSVSFSYNIDKVDYTSTRISQINFTSKKKSVVEKTLKKYPVGSEVKVYYNGSNPAEALLEPGINTGNIMLLGFGILLLAVPVFLVIFLKLK